MNILFVNYNMKSGGAERAVANISNGLSRLGHNITIAIFDDCISDYSLDDSISLVSYKESATNKVSTFFKRIKSARKAFGDVNPDIIISFSARTNVYSLIANLFDKKTIIISERNDPNSDPEQWYYRLLRKILYNFSDGFVFQTNAAKMYFGKNIQSRGKVIPNPVEVLLTNNKQNSNLREHVIVNIGRLSKQKNQKLLIDAFSLIYKDFEDYELVIYGEGHMRKELESYVIVKKLENKVSFPGRFQDIHERIKDSSLFVLSSDYEGMSNALMEAMALGLPCISTDCPIGGSADLIKDRSNGILVPLGDSNKMAVAMKEILSNHEFAESLGREAEKIRLSNSFEIIIDQWERYIVKISNKSNKFKV